MKLKQLIFVAIFIVSCFSISFAQADREKGIELFNKGDFNGAVDVLKQVVKSNENDVIALYNLGLAYEKLNQNKDAIKYFEKAIKVCGKIINDAVVKKYSDANYTLTDDLKAYDKELEAAYSSIQRLSELSPKEAKSKNNRETFGLIEAFASNSEIAKTFSSEKPTTKLKITRQPNAPYTNQARQNGVKGEVRLRILFLANGKIGLIIPISVLSGGLTENSIEAAKQIKFTPASINGKPISVWSMIHYHFTLY
jgi:tetratricopeptide (TPR) repeat protein